MISAKTLTQIKFDSILELSVGTKLEQPLTEADLGFPRGRQPQWRLRQPIIWQNVCQKLHEKE